MASLTVVFLVLAALAAPQSARADNYSDCQAACSVHAGTSQYNPCMMACGQCQQMCAPYVGGPYYTTCFNNCFGPACETCNNGCTSRLNGSCSGTYLTCDGLPGCQGGTLTYCKCKNGEGAVCGCI